MRPPHRHETRTDRKPLAASRPRPVDALAGRAPRLQRPPPPRARRCGTTPPRYRSARPRSEPRRQRERRPQEHWQRAAPVFRWRRLSAAPAGLRLTVPRRNPVPGVAVAGDAGEAAVRLGATAGERASRTPNQTKTTTAAASALTNSQILNTSVGPAFGAGTSDSTAETSCAESTVLSGSAGSDRRAAQKCSGAIAGAIAGEASGSRPNVRAAELINGTSMTRSREAQASSSERSHSRLITRGRPPDRSATT